MPSFYVPWTAAEFKAWRTELNLSVAQAAYHLGVTTTTIWAWEHDRTEMSVRDTLACAFIQQEFERQKNNPTPSG